MEIRKPPGGNGWGVEHKRAGLGSGRSFVADYTVEGRYTGSKSDRIEGKGEAGSAIEDKCDETSGLSSVDDKSADEEVNGRGSAGESKDSNEQQLLASPITMWAYVS